MQIKDLPSSNALAATDVLAKDTSVGTTQKITGQDLADGVKSLAGAASSNQLTDAYSSSATYAVGDLRIYDNTLYKCTTAIETAEAWNAAHWTATTLDEVMVKYADVVNNLVSTATDKPLSAAQGKALNEAIAQSTAYEPITLTAGSGVTINSQGCYKYGKLLIIFFNWSCASNISSYATIATHGYAAKTSWNAPLVNNSNYVQASNGLYADNANTTIRASGTIPAGTYRTFLIIPIE